jgi:hypothetical protein
VTASSGQRKVRQLKYRNQRRQGLRLRRRLWPPLDRPVTISSKDRGGEGTAWSVVGACERDGTALSDGDHCLTGLERLIPVPEPASMPSCARNHAWRRLLVAIAGRRTAALSRARLAARLRGHAIANES